MKEHNVTVLDDLKDMYLDVEEMLQQLEQSLEKRIENKPGIVEKLNKCLQEDIRKIVDQVENVRQEIIKPWFLDVSFFEWIFDNFHNLNTKNVGKFRPISNTGDFSWATGEFVHVSGPVSRVS